MNVVDPDLRLSAQRALLGAISPHIRLIKVRRSGSSITMTTIASQPLGDRAEEALSVATTEIVADFPDCQIEEQLLISSKELPRENLLEQGCVFQRFEELS